MPQVVLATAHAPRSVTVPFLDRRLQPQPDQLQHLPVDDAPRNRLHQLRDAGSCRNTSTNRRPPRPCSHGTAARAPSRSRRPAPARTIAIGTVVKVRLEDRLDHQLHGRLHHPVPNGRDAERSLAAAGLRDHHPPHRLGSIRLLSQVLAKPGQPLFHPCRLNHGERHTVHPRRSRIGAAKRIGVGQNVRPPHLVVELIEAEGRLRLRLEIKLPLKRPDLIGRCQAHRQSPFLHLFESTPEVRALCSAGITRPHSSYDPVRRPPGLPPFPAFGAATPRQNGPPPITRPPLPTCRAHYPGGSRWVRMSVASPSPRPSPKVRRVGIRDFTFEACSGFTRVTAHRLAQPPKAAFVAGLRPSGYPDKPLPATSSTDNSLGGYFLHW